jgi:hypothetical protein
MRARIGVALLALLAFVLVGCSPPAQRVSILANRWQIGEHKTCTFLAPDDLVCDGPEPVTHWEAAQRNQSLSKSVVIERGDYDVSFSPHTSDYSLWDCLKTGTSGIAISCTLVHQPSANEFETLKAEEGYQPELAKIMDTYFSLHSQCGDAIKISNAAHDACMRKLDGATKQAFDSLIGRMSDSAGKASGKFTRINDLIEDAKSKAAIVTTPPE